MKLIVAISISMILGCALVRADEVNPYDSIVARNMFSLVPIPTNNSADEVKPEPPAKITPNGIMTIFGQPQVLFKVATPPKPGQPPQDQSYVMSEGDREDGIGVTKIDVQGGVITFDNHGITQTLPLTKATDVNTPAISPAGRVPEHGMMPGMRRLGMGRGPESMPATPPGTYPVPPPSSMNNNNNTGINPGIPSYGGGYNGVQQQANQLSPEAQAIMIEQNRINTQDQVNQGLMPPLPPTAITPSGAKGANGVSLIPSIP